MGWYGRDLCFDYKVVAPEVRWTSTGPQPSLTYASTGSFAEKEAYIGCEVQVHCVCSVFVYKIKGEVGICKGHRQ